MSVRYMSHVSEAHDACQFMTQVSKAHAAGIYAATIKCVYSFSPVISPREGDTPIHSDQSRYLYFCSEGHLYRAKFPERRSMIFLKRSKILPQSGLIVLEIIHIFLQGPFCTIFHPCVYSYIDGKIIAILMVKIIILGSIYSSFFFKKVSCQG